MKDVENGYYAENMVCKLCHDNDLENVAHLFSRCTWIKNGWNVSQTWLGIQMSLHGVQDML